MLLMLRKMGHEILNTKLIIKKKFTRNQAAYFLQGGDGY